jgi:hypothetical protein
MKNQSTPDRQKHVRMLYERASSMGLTNEDTKRILLKISPTYQPERFKEYIIALQSEANQQAQRLFEQQTAELVALQAKRVPENCPICSGTVVFDPSVLPVMSTIRIVFIGHGQDEDWKAMRARTPAWRCLTQNDGNHYWRFRTQQLREHLEGDQ